MRKYLHEGEQTPKDYRIAWENPWERRWVCYPFGLHWLMRGCHRIWEWSFHYRPSTIEEAFHEMAILQRECRWLHETVEENQRYIKELKEQHKQELLDVTTERDKAHQLDLDIINTLTQLVKEYEKYVPSDQRPNPAAWDNPHSNPSADVNKAIKEAFENIGL